MPIPDWVKAHRPKNSEIRLFGNTYYAYHVTSVWDREKKRPRKITGKLIGKITPEGLVPSEKAQLRNALQTSPSVKEYGAYRICQQLLESELKTMKTVFGQPFHELFLMAYLRVAYQAHLNMMPLYAQYSYASVEMSLRMSAPSLSDILSQIGSQREKIVVFKKNLFTGKDFILIDSTPMFSESDQLEINQLGYNNKRIYRKQINLLMLVSTTVLMPVYYRMLAGHLRDVQAFKLSLKESGIQDAVLIADKGFYSSNNIKALKTEQCRFIIPLRRNHSFINYKPLSQPGKSGFDGYFHYHNRPIWYYACQHQKDNLCVFLDPHYKIQEEQDYLQRIDTHPENYNLADFKKKERTFGTLALLNNISGLSPEDCYRYYKTRMGVEKTFDTFKNMLEADRSFMRTPQSLEGWLFINFLAIRLYYKLMHRLKESKLLAKHSPADVLARAKMVKKVQMNNQWLTSEISKKDTALFTHLGIPIT